MKVFFIFGLATFTFASENDKQRLKNEITIENEQKNVSRVVREW